MKDPAPLPVSVTPGMPLLFESSTATSSDPLFGTRDPLGGETSVVAVTGWSGPIPVQETLDGQLEVVA